MAGALGVALIVLAVGLLVFQSAWHKALAGPRPPGGAGTAPAGPSPGEGPAGSAPATLAPLPAAPFAPTIARDFGLARTRLFGYGAAHATDDAPGYRHIGGYAVVGLVTTGFTPMRDRIIEIAVVRLDERGQVVSEWDTLVQPRRADTGAVFMHGLTPQLLAGAPTFAQIAGHVLRQLEGAVVVTHLSELVEQFLAAESLHAGLLTPSIPALSTVRLGQLTFPTANLRLATLAAHLGVEAPDLASALGQARLVAHLIPPILARHGSRLTYPWPPAAGAVADTRPVPRYRRRAADRVAPVATIPWLAGLLARVPMSAKEANDPRTAAYLEGLGSLLSSGQIVADQTRALSHLLATSGYTAVEIRSLTERLLESLREVAFEDASLSPTQVRHLRATATSVGAPTYFDDLSTPAPPPAPEPGSGSFSRPVRRPPPPAPPARLPRCARCLAMGHYSTDCSRAAVAALPGAPAP